jgi:flagellar motility protein MotE (MotC chaperone)
MPPADAGKIMGAMKPDNAAELATQIAMRQSSSEAKK